MICYLTGELIFIEHILHTWYCSETLDGLTHLILKIVLWLRSYLDHTHTDSDDANIQEVGLKPHCCFFIASLEKITNTNYIAVLFNFTKRFLWKDSLYFALCRET